MKIPENKCLRICHRYFSISFTYDEYAEETYAVVVEAKLRLAGAVGKGGAVLAQDCWSVMHLHTLDLQWSCEERWQYAMICLGYQPFGHERMADFRNEDDMEYYKYHMRTKGICEDDSEFLTQLPSKVRS